MIDSLRGQSTQLLGNICGQAMLRYRRSFRNYVDDLRQQPSDRPDPPWPKKSLVIVKPDRFTAWRRVARVSYGISGEDPRFSQSMEALDACDEAYLANDGAKFRRSAKLITRIVGT
jgi:hypothetical protein